MAKANIHVISEIIGEEAALKLARSLPAYGGRRSLYVPVRWKNAAWLVQIIGFEKAMLLHVEMAGCQIRIGDLTLYERRRTATRMLRSPEISISEISRMTGFSRSSLYRHWSAAA